MSKSPWRYPKQAYKLYKSAELHTKQSRKAPAVLWFILAAFAGAAYAFPTLQTRLTERISGKPAETQTATNTPKENVTTYEKDGIRYTVETTKTSVPMAAASAPIADGGAPVLPPAPQPVVAGCIVAPSSGCKCFDTQGFKVPVVADLCPDPKQKKPVETLAMTPENTPAQPLAAGDLQTMALVFGAKSYR